MSNDHLGIDLTNAIEKLTNMSDEERAKSKERMKTSKKANYTKGVRS